MFINVGTTSVKTSVVKDGNVFMIHVMEPAEEVKPESSSEVEKAETEESEKAKGRCTVTIIILTYLSFVLLGSETVTVIILSIYFRSVLIYLQSCICLYTDTGCLCL